MNRAAQMMRILWGFGLLLVCVFSASLSYAQSFQLTPPDGEPSLDVEMSTGLKAGGSNIIGDSIDINSGSLSLTATDVSLPGNSGLAVAFSRSYALDGIDYHEGILGTWNIDIPFITARTLEDEWKNDRCTGTLRQWFPHDTLDEDELQVANDDIWGGARMFIPGQGGKLLMEDVVGSSTFWGGSPPAKTTTDHWRVDCLTTLQNGPGEGFEATAPNGDIYTFDYWAPKAGGTIGTFSVREGGCDDDFCEPSEVNPAYATHTNIYATQVTDVNGNWVKYEFDGNGNIERIHANDGREINIDYTDGRISSIKVSFINLTTNAIDERVWNYSYELIGNLHILDKVTRPDSLFWEYDVGAQLPNQKGISCNYDASHIAGTLTVKHPNGTVGNFDYEVIKNGKNNASDQTGLNWTGLDLTEDENGEPVIAEVEAGCDDFRMQSFSQTKAITTKTLTLPWSNGSPLTSSWSYWYEEDEGCRGSCPASLDLKKRIVTNPLGHETHYWYNRRHEGPYEGKLMKTETHDGSDFLQQTDYQYYLAPSLGDSTVRTSASEPPSSQILPMQTIQQRDGDTFTSQSDYNMELTSSYSFGRPTTTTVFSNVQTTPLTTVTTYEHKKAHWILGLPKTVTTHGRLMSEYNYDNLGRTNWREDYGVRTADYSYYGDGTIHTVTDAAGRITTVNSWKRGKPESITRNDSTTTANGIDENGWLMSQTNAKGYTTTYQRDNMGRVTRITPHTPATGSKLVDTTIIYNFNTTPITQTITTGVKRDIIHLDSLLRPARNLTYDFVTSKSVWTNTKFDALGQTSFTSFPSTNPNESDGVSTSYDALGRMTQTAENVAPFAKTSYSYHPYHRTRVIDPEGGQTNSYAIGYDGAGGTDYNAIYHAFGQRTQIYKNAWRETVGVRQFGTQNGIWSNLYQYFYYEPVHHRMCRSYTKEGGDTVYGYNAAGELTSYQKGLSNNTTCIAPAGTNKVTMTYDNMGRLEDTLFTDPATPDIFRDYDDNGNLTQLDRGTGTSAVKWDYSFDEYDRLTSEELTLDSKSFDTSYLYNAYGYMYRKFLPSGRGITYTNDGLGRHTKVSWGSGPNSIYAQNASYHPSGALEALEYGNEQIFTQTLNNRRLPETLHVAKAGNTALDLTYSYNKRGQIAGQINGVSAGHTRSYVYDPQGRLTAANSGAWGTASYGYDTLGNLRSKSFSHWPLGGGGTGVRSITNSYDDVKNRVISSNDNGVNRTIAYDARGNVTTLGSLAFIYDRSDQPTVVTGAANGNYLYDGNLKRVKSVVNGKTIYNVYDVSGALIHVDEITDNKETDYLHGMGQTLARIKNDVFTYLHPDHLGSAQTGTHGTTGAVLWSEHYTPYGEALVGAAANDNQAGFTGHIKDKATGLNYMQARYYDPNIGRFLSVDPVTFLDTGNPSYFNRYRYCANDPVNCTDPTGMNDDSFLKQFFDFGAKDAAAQANSTMTEAATASGMSGMDPGRSTRMLNDTMAAGALGLAEAGANGAANIADQALNEVPSSAMEGDKVGVGIGLATAFIPARAPGKNQAVRNAAEGVGEFLGDAYKVKRNDSKGFVAMSADGNRRFRSDIGGHGDKPHAHLEIKNEHGNFKDATDQHRIYYDD